MTSHSGNFSASNLTSSEASCSWRRDCSSSHSSRDGACSSPTMGEASKKNFSSSSLTGYGYHYTYPRVSVNKHLLAPLHLDIDPALQEIRAKEKEEIKTLNNQFAALIGKVQNLEQHNQVLLTRWNFLKEQDNSLSDLDIKLLYDRYMNKLSLEIRSIDAEKEQLDSELDEVLASMDTFRSKYEKEINKRTGLEFTFTTLKKDLDNGFLHKTELEMKLNGLHAWVELMNTIHEKELEEVMSQIKDVSIVLGIDNNRYMPDPHRIVEDVRAQYEDLAIRSWEELEALTRSKLNEREALSVKYGDHLLNDRRVIAELNIQIQKMRSCIVSLKSQCLQLEENIKGVGLQGETALNDAKSKLAKLEDALHSARQDLAQLVKKYQELMNIKLALDIEILTYRKLVEGEETSMESPPSAFISKIYSRPKSFLSNSGITDVPDVASRAKDLTNKMIHSGSSLETGPSGSHNGGSKVASSDGFCGSQNNRSYTSESRDTSEVFRSPSLGSPSRSSSNRSGNFADIEDTMESNNSRSYSQWIGSNRSHSSRSGDNLESSRYPSGEIRDISEGSLSRAQSNESGALTETVFARTHSETSDNIQENNGSGSPSHRNVGFLSSEFSRTQSEESNNSSGSRYHTYRKESGDQSQSQGNRNGEFIDNAFARSHSGDISEGSLFRSYSGTSASYTEGGLSRSQSDENEQRDIHGNEGYVEPMVSRTTSAEDGGVPVGDISEANPSRSQSDETEFRGSHEELAEPILTRTRSAEDGGVPISGISGTSSETNRGISEVSPSRSQSDENEHRDIHGYERCAEPMVFRTNSAEDGGVPVGGTFRTHSGASSDISEVSPSRSQSDETEFRGSHEEFAEPILTRTRGAEDGGVPVGGVSKSSSKASRNSSLGAFSKIQRDESPGCTDTVFTQAQEGNLHNYPSNTNPDFAEGSVSRSLSGDKKSVSKGRGFGTPSIRSTTLSDSVFIRSPTSVDEDTCEESVLKIHSTARESALETDISGDPSPRSEELSASDLSRLHTMDSRGDSDNNPSLHGCGSKNKPDSGFSKNYNRKEGLTKTAFARESDSTKDDSLSSQNDGTEGFVKSVVSRINRGILKSGSSGSQSSSRSGSFKASDLLSKSSSEESQGISEANISSSCGKENEKCTEGMISRTYSYRSAVTSYPKTESAKAEDVPESELYRSPSSESEISPPGIYRGQSGERENESEVALSRSYSNDEVAMNNQCISHDNRNE